MERFYQRNGKNEGEYILWHKNGQPWVCQYFRDGKTEGEVKVWHSNGYPCRYLLGKGGKIDGECKCWNKNGKIEKREFYRDGKVIDENFNHSKKRIFLRIVKNSRKRIIYSANIMLIFDLFQIVSCFG